MNMDFTEISIKVLLEFLIILFFCIVWPLRKDVFMHLSCSCSTMLLSIGICVQNVQQEIDGCHVCPITARKEGKKVG